MFEFISNQWSEQNVLCFLKKYKTNNSLTTCWATLLLYLNWNKSSEESSCFEKMIKKCKYHSRKDECYSNVCMNTNTVFTAWIIGKLRNLKLVCQIAMAKFLFVTDRQIQACWLMKIPEIISCINVWSSVYRMSSKANE